VPEAEVAKLRERTTGFYVAPAINLHDVREGVERFLHLNWGIYGGRDIKPAVRSRSFATSAARPHAQLHANR
jgi:hypothetical protein